MVEVVDELRAKLVEIDGKMEELRREIVVLGARQRTNPSCLMVSAQVDIVEGL